MPSQRQLGLRSLTGVLRGRAACIARGETPPHPRLPEMVPVAIRWVRVEFCMPSRGVLFGIFFNSDLQRDHSSALLVSHL